MGGSSYIKLSEELNHSRESLDNIHIFRYLHTVDKNLARIKKINKEFAKELDFKGTKFPVKIRNINELEKKYVLSALMFLFMEIRKNFQSTF